MAIPFSKKNEEMFETPELAKREIIKEEISENLNEAIYTIPSRLRRTSVSPVQKFINFSKKFWFVYIIILILILVIGSIAFYRWADKYLKRNKQSEQPIAQREEKTPSPEAAVTTESSEQTLRAEIKDINNQVIAWAELLLPAGAINPDLGLELKGEIASPEIPTGNFEVIAGLYKIQATSTTTPIILNKPITLKISYQPNLVNTEWEKNLQIGYFKDNLWTLTDSEVDLNLHQISINFDFLPADTFAILIEKSKMFAERQSPIAPQIPSSQDSDQDGLTDVEEQIYQTNPNNPDTDGDNIADGLEIINLSNPLKSTGNLALSGLVNVYLNSNFNYSLFYPASWLVRAIPETENSEILVITNTGEFFGLTVEDNSDEISLTEWYLKQAPKISRSILKEVTIDNKKALWSPDGLTVYLTKPDSSNPVYILNYNIGTETKANFKSTFEMLIKSFQFTIPTPSPTSTPVL